MAPQLVVIDSGSRDGGAALARAHGADVVELPGNPGFGAATNAGLEHARHEVAVLLNPDCELIDGSLAALAELARGHPRALHAPRLLNADGSVQRSAHPLPGTVGALVPALVHPPLLPRSVRERAEPHRAETARTVGWAIAACLASATATLRRARAVRSRRASVLGGHGPVPACAGRRMPTVLHPDLELRHTGGHATRRSGEPLELIGRRRRETVASTLGPRALALDDLAQALTFTARAAGHALLGGDAARPRAQLAAVRRARRRRCG